ncbi:MAG: exoribonuclease [Pseudomonadota bacterium]
MRPPRASEPPAVAMLAVLERAAPRPLSLREIAERLGLERFDPRLLQAGLDVQVAERRLRRIGKNRYQWLAERLPRDRGGFVPDRGVRPRGDALRADRDRVDRRRVAPADPAGPRGRIERRGPIAPAAAAGPAAPSVTGRYSRVRAGFGFVAPEGAARERFPTDVFVPEGMEGSALHGDRVRVEVLRLDPGTSRASGRIAEVVESGVDRVIGVLENGRHGSAAEPTARRARRAARPGPEPERRWWLAPQSDLLPVVSIEGGMEPSAFDAGKLAVVRLTRRPGPVRGAAGELEQVLGDAEDPDVQFLTIALEHGLRIDFPPEVEAECSGLPADPHPEDLRDREDLRDLPFVTIDGESARDFDDAVCLEPAPGGAHRLRVAIADVAHHVRPGSALDAEARARGTSVYFPDRAIPMLPEALSNGLCSLVPGRDRLVLVADLLLDRRGLRKSARFHRGVIRSRARLTYGQVAAVLSSTDTREIEEQREALADLLPQLQRMRDLMRVLYRRRIDAGSLDLDLPEALVDLSEEGRSVGVRLSVRNDAHRIIEEMMLEANQAVALHLGEAGLPFPYRIHEPPDAVDVVELNELLGAFGASVEFDEEAGPRPRDVQRALVALDGHRLSRVLSRQVLRTLKQAEYSTVNRGHFGLAFATYCHFTSPIRRYPDLLVHRQLGALLDGAAEDARGLGAEMAESARTSSERERAAVAAERAMLDLKKAEFMLDHLLEPAEATVVSVARAGAWAELDAWPIEGRIDTERLPEPFEFDPRSRALVGVRTGARLRLGDRLRVEATDVSLRRRRIGFAVLEHLGPPGGIEGAGPSEQGRGGVRRRAGRRQAGRGR